MAFNPDTACSFCGYPGTRHMGGGEMNGIKVSGHFCNEECFQKWLSWKAMLINAKLKATPFPEPILNEAQAVLPV